MKRWLLAVLLGLTLSATIAAVMIPGFIKDLQQEDALVSRGARTQAVVVATAPRQHAQCTYDFVAGSRHYQSTGLGCANLGVGGHLAIYYLPDNPNVSTHGRPGEGDPGGWIFLIWLLVVPPAFLVFVMTRRSVIRSEAGQL